jgi:hypothetical protein
MLLKHFSAESKSTTWENVHIADALKARDQSFWRGRTARVVHHRLYSGDEASREAKPPTARERPIDFVYNGTADCANSLFKIIQEHLPDFAKIVFQRTRIVIQEKHVLSRADIDACVPLASETR